MRRYLEINKNRNKFVSTSNDIVFKKCCQLWERRSHLFCVWFYRSFRLTDPAGAADKENTMETNYGRKKRWK